MTKNLPRTDSPLSFRLPPFLTDPVFVFTDGSANPSHLPNIRLSSWAVCISDTWLGQVRPHVAGITPGSHHDISRAETYAILACLEAVAKATIFCDNKGVVQVMSTLLDGTFDCFTARGHPNLDLWQRIYQLLLTRPAGSVSIHKVKSHQHAHLLCDPVERWKAQGNDAADAFAKTTSETHTLSVTAANPDWTVAREIQRIDQAFLATRFLHEVSLHLFNLRNSQQVPPEPRRSDLPVPPQQPDPTTIPHRCPGNIPRTSVGQQMVDTCLLLF